ncbi:MAG: CRTAC1 family protein [Candidatus Latescibacteria bacterium]|jgi:enediyne biosynthesis protein E4|nr:CRTAC1 family protein [Candidatus Latescibacterota bacterium]
MATRRQRQLHWTIGLTTAAIVVSAIAIFNRSLNPSGSGDEITQLSEIARALMRDLPDDHPNVTFTDATTSAGVSFVHFYGDRTTRLPEDMGSGAAWGDYDNDGDSDLYFVNTSGALALTPAQRQDSPARNMLYQNNGDGTFDDVTDKAAVGSHAMGMGATWGDHDNDGDLDLYVTNFGRNILYDNNGDGTFSDFTSRARVDGNSDGFWSGAVWCDYDRDGDLDLYVCNYVGYSDQLSELGTASPQYGALVPYTLNPSSYDPLPNVLYRNNGNGTFTDVAKQAGVDNPEGRSLGAVFCDLDNDGWQDLYVANDVSESKLYWNRGDGTFEDASAITWAADYRGAMGIAVGDWENDGDFDIFKTHWIAQENAFYNNLTEDMNDMIDRGSKGGVPEFLRFTDLADRYGLGEISLDMVGWGTGFMDYDNDGRLDVFIVNGSTFENREDTRKLIRQPNMLFWNRDSEEGFYNVTSVSGDALQKANVGRGAAFNDYDMDGDVDIAIVSNGEAAVLLRNENPNAHQSITVRLHGTISNRFAVGARVTVSADSTRQVQDVGSGVSYLSFGGHDLVFGLGRYSQADSVSVRWPNSDEQIITNIASNSLVEITEQNGYTLSQRSLTQ